MLMYELHELLCLIYLHELRYLSSPAIHGAGQICSQHFLGCAMTSTAAENGEPTQR